MKKRFISDNEVKILEPILVRLNKNESTTPDIHIDKSVFKIGRGKDNDEIILDTSISRKHCIIRYEGNGEWAIKDSSSSYTFVNDVVLESGSKRKLSVGDIIQLSTNSDYKYVFTLNLTKETSCKKQKLDEELFNNVLILEQKTLVENQESQKKELQDGLENKQKQQLELKQKFNDLLEQWDIVPDDKESLKDQIVKLENKITANNNQEKHLQNMYSELQKKLENEQILFEARLNEERQKWQKALDISKQEKELLEVKMKEQMEKWREEQVEWKNKMKDRIKKEKTIQARLLTEKIQLEEKLKETTKALKDKQIKSESLGSENESGTTMFTEDSCVLLKVVDNSKVCIIDTIDLTENNEDNSITSKDVMNKVSTIMDEQLTCSVCSELFINATTLNCMHTFCLHCINEWSKKRRECPICRVFVTSMNRSLVLDNFIEKMLDSLPTHMKDKRAEIVKERKVLEKMKKGRIK